MNDNQLLLELLQRFDERACLPPALLEQAVAGSLSLAEAADVHAHLRQCVSCLGVFSRLQSLQETDVGVVPTPAPPAELLQAVSPAIIALRDRVGRLLQVSARRGLPPVLIEGESGTGKGFLARLIHRASTRRDAPFVEVDCAAIPEELLEAEIFGYARGAFTGVVGKPGLLQIAHGGTIFLDEVGLLPAGLQTKFLGALVERRVRRVGSARAEPIDVWVLTATTEDLRAAVQGRRFREDLYYRLAVVTLPVPSLRERGGDILMLAEHYLRQACANYGASAKTLAADARAALCAYAWPGNDRELANVMERAAILSPEAVVTASILGLPGSEVERPPGGEADAAADPDE